MADSTTVRGPHKRAQAVSMRNRLYASIFAWIVLLVVLAIGKAVLWLVG